MVWGWSHSQEAYENALLNLTDLDDNTLATVYCEWKCRDIEQAEEDLPDSTCPFTDGRYDRMFEKVLSDIKEGWNDTVVDFIWERSCEQSLCTNGGWAAWICPYGCHTGRRAPC